MGQRGYNETDLKETIGRDFVILDERFPEILEFDDFKIQFPDGNVQLLFRLANECK